MSILGDIYFIILGSLWVCLSPFCFVLFLPTLIWRPIANKLRPHYRPDLENILSCSSSVFAQMDDGPNITNTVNLIRLTLKGNISHDQLLRAIDNAWINCKSETDPGKLRYPELQQYITDWAGYKFWKNEENFDLRRHIHVTHHKDLDQITEQLVCGSFTSEWSPWDITLRSPRPEDGEECSEIFMRFHHALTDGFSTLFLLQRLFGGEPNDNIVTTKPTKTSSMQILLLPVKVLRIIGELIHSMISPSLWKIPQKEKSRQWYIANGKNIQLSTIFRIKKHFNVSVTAVILSIAAGGLRRFILEEKKDTLPDSLTTVMTAPVDNHPDKLCNQFSFTTSSYPVGKADPVDRINSMHARLETLRGLPISTIGHWAFQLHGCHFNAVGKLLNSFRYAPIVSSYFPLVLNVNNPNIEGRRLIGTVWYMRIQQGQQGGILCMSTYEENVNFNMVFNQRCLRREEAHRLSGWVDKEVDVLLEAMGDKNNGDNNSEEKKMR